MSGNMPFDRVRWERAAHLIVAALVRQAEDGGLVEPDLVGIIHREGHIAPEVTRDALDHLVREGLIGRQEQQGLVVRGTLYHLTPRGAAVVGGAPHAFLRFRLEY